MPHRSVRRRPGALRATAAAVACLGVAAALGQDRAPDSLDAARYDASGKLAFPAFTDHWIAVGSDIGGNYAAGAFDPANPGTIGVVQMEPGAYDYFLKNRRYADGTMFLLTFYAVQRDPDPALKGFVQGDVVGREVHVLDARRYAAEGRAFFVFGTDTAPPVAAQPLGSACVACHMQHGAFAGTFVQFYPPLRNAVAAGR